MGGEPRKKESNNCKEWRVNSNVWDILKNGKVMAYIDKLQGYKPHITKSFKNRIEDRVMLHGVTMKFSEEFITKIMGLPMEGLKFSKETSILNVSFKKFPKTNEEEKKMEKNGNFYDLIQIKVIWRDVLSCIH